MLGQGLVFRRSLPIERMPMPVMLTTVDEVKQRLEAPMAEALQKPAYGRRPHPERVDLSKYRYRASLAASCGEG